MFVRSLKCQISSGLFSPFRKCKYLNAEIASLAPLVPFHDCKCLALYILHGLPLRLSTLTEGTAMVTVFSRGVKLQ